MTMYEAKDRIARTIEGWVGRLVLGALVALTGTFAFQAWQTVQQTQDAVNSNGKSEARLEGKFDTLTATIGQFQAQVSAQRTIDDIQTAALNAVKSDLTRLEQAFNDHARDDAVLVPPTRTR